MLKNSMDTKLLLLGGEDKKKIYLPSRKIYTNSVMLATLWVGNRKCTFICSVPNHFMLISWRTKAQKMIASTYKQVLYEMKHENESGRLCLILLNVLSKLTGPFCAAKNNPYYTKQTRKKTCFPIKYTLDGSP